MITVEEEKEINGGRVEEKNLKNPLLLQKILYLEE